MLVDLLQAAVDRAVLGLPAGLQQCLSQLLQVLLVLAEQVHLLHAVLRNRTQQPVDKVGTLTLKLGVPVFFFLHTNKYASIFGHFQNTALQSTLLCGCVKGQMGENEAFRIIQAIVGGLHLLIACS